MELKKRLVDGNMLGVSQVGGEAGGIDGVSLEALTGKMTCRHSWRASCSVSWRHEALGKSTSSATRWSANSSSSAGP